MKGRMFQFHTTVSIREASPSLWNDWTYRFMNVKAGLGNMRNLFESFFQDLRFRMRISLPPRRNFTSSMKWRIK